MQEIEIDLRITIGELYTEHLVGLLSNHFKGKGFEFFSLPVGSRGDTFQLKAKGDIGNQRDNLNFWCGYFSAQLNMHLPSGSSAA